MILRPPHPAVLLLAHPSTSLFYCPPFVRSRRFSLTRLLRDNPPTHYEILKVPTNVTQKELKKQFYILSKETHPDINPGDPQASERFAAISESYSILAHAEKRKRYDRDVLRQNPESKPHRRSGTYAGSRPASGLSKRRGTFRGPPPSYYAHGNPTQSQSQSSAQSSTQSTTAGNASGTFNAAGFAPDGQYDPFFDATSTYRTQSQEDIRRLSRRQAALAKAQQESEDESNFWARFVIVSSVIALGVSLATVIATRANVPKGGLVRADGSRRDGPKNEWTKG